MYARVMESFFDICARQELKVIRDSPLVAAAAELFADAPMIKWPTSSTAAKPIGQCYRCGAMRYAGLVHHCGTALRLTEVIVFADGQRFVGSPSNLKAQPG